MSMVQALLVCAFAGTVLGATAKSKTFYEFSGDEEEGVCQCTIATSWSEMEEYQKLQATMAKLEKAIKLQHSMDYEQILGQMANYTDRLQHLEDHINSQSVDTSITELFSLRKAVAALVKKVELTSAKDTAEGVKEKIYAELAMIKKYTDEAWEKNPYKQRNHYKEQLSIIRERLYKDGATVPQTPFQGDLLPIHIPPSEGWCSNGNVTFGRPYTYKYEPRAQSQSRRNYGQQYVTYDYGAWCKDPKPIVNNDKERICLTSYERKSRYSSSSTKNAKCFNNHKKFVDNIANQTYPVAKTTIVLYMGSLFFIAENNVLTKIHLSTGVRTSVRITYSGSNIQLQVDEEGLWLIYSITSDGKPAISKVDPYTMVIRKTWIIEEQISWCSAFMMCGKMYAVKTCTRNTVDEANFVFDTHTSTGYNARYSFPSLYGKVENLVYNSRERVIFGWDKRHMVTYQIISSGTMS